MGWIKGVPSDQTRQNDVPFKEELSESTYHPQFTVIPTFGHFNNKRMVRINVGYNLIQRTPLNVDPVWLAVMMMFLQSVIKNFDDMTFVRVELDDIKAQQLEIIKKMLVTLCEIGEQRRLFDIVLINHFKDLEVLE